MRVISVSPGLRGLTLCSRGLTLCLRLPTLSTTHLRWLAVAALLSSSCDRGRVETLEREVASLKQALAEQQKAFEADREAVGHILDAGETVTLRRTDEGYDALWHDLGVFAIELAEVTPTEAGSRVKLRVGNVTAAAVNDVEALVEWGQDPDELPAPYSQRMSLGRLLPASAWSEVTLDLDGVPPPELGYVRITDLTVGSVSLRQPPPRGSP